MLGASELSKAMEKGYAEKRKFGALEYIRFRAGHGETERGSVITKWGFFPGFPHIKRIFTLGKGLEKNISGDVVYAEEKIDGYNLRAALINGDVYALSRGGIIDAFSTEKLRELIPGKAFEFQGRKVMLCGEMIGNTPYTAPSRDFDVRYFIFDIYDLERDAYLGPEERYAFLRKNGLESVPQLGKFRKHEQIKKLRELALNLNKARKEGVVFKSEDRLQVVKYVNPNADIEDFGNGIKQIFDMPTGFFNQRVLRSAIFIKEYGLDSEAYGNALGKLAYRKFAEGLKMLEKEGAIYDEFEILVKDGGIWNELKSHMGTDVKLEKVFEKEEAGKTRIRFRKIYTKSTKKLREFLNGKGITD